MRDFWNGEEQQRRNRRVKLAAHYQEGLFQEKKPTNKIILHSISPSYPRQFRRFQHFQRVFRYTLLVLNDAELIREQRRIFEEIQRQHEAKPSAKDKDDLHYTTNHTTQMEVDSPHGWWRWKFVRRMQHLHLHARCHCN
jgi:hypothetical protein